MTPIPLLATSDPAKAQAPSLAMRLRGSKPLRVNEPVDIRAIEGRPWAEDLRCLAAGEVTPEEIGDLLRTDYTSTAEPP
jgi:hypothetical protein